MNNQHPPAFSKVLAFAPQRDAGPVVNLANFIRMCREELTVFGDDLDWQSWRWKGVGQFLKLGCPKIASNPEGLHFHPMFVDFAKAYVRYSAGHSPEARPGRVALQMLRVVERALIECNNMADPVEISLVTLDRAAEIASRHWTPAHAYSIGRRLQTLAQFLSDNYLVNMFLGTWQSPLATPDSGLGVRLGAEGEAHRLSRLPDTRALEAIGTVFAKGFDLTDHSTYRDVYVTSTVAILMGYSARGQEVHELTIDLEIERPDLEGDTQYGHRYRAFKVAQSTSIKHVPEDWVPFSKEAVDRIRKITESARAFARYAEAQLKGRKRNPNFKLRFYRHSGCPPVADNQPLTAKEAAAALGCLGNDWRRGLSGRGFSTEDWVYTLDSLWPWVLEQLPPGFPFVSGAKNKKLKYSNALFCMHFNHIRKGAVPNPVTLWIPTLDSLRTNLNGGSTSIGFFERHGCRTEDDEVVHLGSHQIRHLLNTLAHDGTGDTFIDSQMINYWSGRDRNWQGETYNHVSAEERARRAGDAMQRNDGSYAVIELARSKPSERDSNKVHWTVCRPAPKSCADLDMHHRSAVLMTAYGSCEHDWLLEPCQFHKDCLNCNEHFCIKGAGNNDQERLDRIRALLQKVLVQQELAKAAADDCEPGSQFWYEYQTSYRERLEQLIALLEHPDVGEGSVIRLAQPGTNSHLHRVLRATALQGMENRSSASALIDELAAVYRQNSSLDVIQPSSLESCSPETDGA